MINTATCGAAVGFRSYVAAQTGLSIRTISNILRGATPSARTAEVLWRFR
jgi:hypothetical protein